MGGAPKNLHQCDMIVILFMMGGASVYFSSTPLPSKVVEARDVEQFKAELDEAWKDIQFLHTAL